MARSLAVSILSTLLWVIPFQGQSLAHVFTASTSLNARDIPSGEVERGDRVLIVGKLKSGQSDCRQGELVKLKRRSRTLDTDRTDAEGEYRFKIKARKSIRVFVRFDGSVQTSYGHSHTCNASSSRSLSVKVERPGGDGGGPNCHSSYPDFCIPPPPPDLDCDQVNGSNFTVVGSDPHGFDGDNDGVGCET